VSALRDRGRDCAYVANSNPVRTYPRGLDTEAFPIGALESAWRDAAQPYEREHVTPYIWQNPTRFPQFCVTNPQDASFHRWTVDTPEDLALTEAIYEHFGHNRFAWTEVLAAFDEHPEWFAINGRIRQKAM
jgi:spore coat polysaccharide biosynthesis protein SpsF